MNKRGAYFRCSDTVILPRSARFLLAVKILMNLNMFCDDLSRNSLCMRIFGYVQTTIAFGPYFVEVDAERGQCVRAARQSEDCVSSLDISTATR